jgi:hypothetical protein
LLIPTPAGENGAGEPNRITAFSVPSAGCELKVEHRVQLLIRRPLRLGLGLVDLALKVASNFNGSPDADFAFPQPCCDLKDYILRERCAVTPGRDLLKISAIFQASNRANRGSVIELPQSEIAEN